MFTKKHVEQVLKECLTPQEVAEAEGVHYRTVLNWIRAGKLEALTAGERCVLIPYASLLRYRKNR